MIGKLFSRRAKTMVFIDYEYWFYTYKNKLGLRPDPARFRASLEAEFDIADIMVFADFSVPVMSPELHRLRSITNTIIETGNTVQRRRKDMTDFVMLDYIYRCIDDNKRIGTYIIFSGDGHFQSVARHLSQRKHKRVIVYGIDGTVSRQLQTVASEVRYIPTDEELNLKAYRQIAENMDSIEGRADIIPTFNGTLDAVVEQNDADRDRIHGALEHMLNAGYLYQKPRRMNRRRVIKVMAADWDRLAEDEIYRRERTSD